MHDPQELGDEVMATVAGLRRVVRARVRALLPGPRLRGAHLELLRIVQRNPGIGVAAAARSLYLAANSVSTLVNQLVDEGLLIRRTDPADRRAALLSLTPAAEQRLGTWRAERSKLVAAEVAQLSAADRQRIADALPALRTLLDRLDNPEDE